MKNKEQLLKEEFVQPPSTVKDEDAKKFLEEERFEKKIDKLIEEFQGNASSRPPKETPIPRGRAFGTLKETFRERKEDNHIISMLEIDLSDGSDIYHIWLSSKKRKTDKYVEEAVATFTREYRDVKRKFEELINLEAVPEIRNFFDRYKLTVPFEKPIS